MKTKKLTPCIPDPIDLSLQTFADPRAEKIIESARPILAKNFGVTISGPYLTLRWKTADGAFIQESFQAYSLTSSNILEEIEDK